MNHQDIIEAVLLAHSEPLDAKTLRHCFMPDAMPSAQEIDTALAALCEQASSPLYEVVKVASGYRIQIKPAFNPYIHRGNLEKPSKYSRALLETLAIIAWRQPVTRGDIEQIRGVSVSSQLMATLLERGWVTIIGHRDVPGRPAIYATTQQFLDYFGLQHLAELPTLEELAHDDG